MLHITSTTSQSASPAGPANICEETLWRCCVFKKGRGILQGEALCFGGGASVILAGRQVNKGEDVVLDEAGEAQEDQVKQETADAQTFVQSPLVQVDPQDLRTGGEEMFKEAEAQCSEKQKTAGAEGTVNSR